MTERKTITRRPASPYANAHNEAKARAAFCARLIGRRTIFECWPIRTHRADGYAKFGAGNAFGTGEVYTHRIVYRLVWGKIRKGYEGDHVCRTRNCVNPLHLEAVPIAENRRRKIGHVKLKSRCPRGHPYRGRNLYVNPRTGKRHCRECMRVANRQLRASKSTHQPDREG